MKRHNTTNRIELGAVGFVIAAALTCGSAVAAAPPGSPYDIIDLGTLGGETSSAVDVSRDGWVVGTSELVEGTYHAFVWYDGNMTDLGTLGGTWSEARAINTSHQIVGVSETKDGELHAFLWDDGVMHDLNDLLKDSDRKTLRSGEVFGEALFINGVTSLDIFEANDINDAGTIVACAWRGAEEVGLVLDQSDAFGVVEYELGYLANAETCYPFSVNEAMMVTGVSGGHAFYWMDGAIMPLDPVDSTYLSVAWSNNDAGRSVGFWSSLGELPRACQWMETPDSERQDLLVPAQSVVSMALDVNAWGFSVGWSADRSDSKHAMLWYDADSYIDLNDIVVTDYPWTVLREAAAIDEVGRVVGTGSTVDGTDRAFLLMPRVESPN